MNTDVATFIFDQKRKHLKSDIFGILIDFSYLSLNLSGFNYLIS